MIKHDCGFCERTFFTLDKDNYPERCPWCGSTSEVVEDSKISKALERAMQAVEEQF
jgi:DNA-directed RNA polymerase subunit RPC12/RpoP